MFKIMFMQMTEASVWSMLGVVTSLISLGLWQLKKLFKVDLLNWENVKLFSFQRLGSSLFHSITIEGKNDFLKKS